MDKKVATYKLPEGWIEVEIQEISLKINYGYTAKSTTGNTGTKLLRITDIQNNKVEWETVPFCNIDEYDISKYLLREGDIVFARTGATVGKSFLIKGKIPKAVFASYLIRIQLSKLVNPDYLNLYFQSADYWKQIGIKSIGVGQPHVNASSLSNLKLPLPPLNEQQRIVSKVDELFSELDHAEQALKKAQRQLEVYRQSLLKNAFEGRLTEKWREFNDADQKNKSTRHNNIPGIWNWTILGNVGKLISGQHILEKDYNQTANGTPYLTGPSDFGDKYPIITRWTNNPKVLTGIDDILITVKGSGVGKLNIANKELAIGRQIMAYRFQSGSTLYIYYYLESISLRLKKLSTGSAIPGISRDSILSLNCPIPPEKEQYQIVQELESRFTHIENLNSSISLGLQKTEIFRHAILKKAFQGELVLQYSNDEAAIQLLKQIQREKQINLNAQKEAIKLNPKNKRTMEKGKTVLELLKEAEVPIAAKELWQKSIHKDDIEDFYAELKEIYIQIAEIKKNTESLLSLKK